MDNTKQRIYRHYFHTPGKTARDSMFYVESVGHYLCDKSFFEDSYYKSNYYIIFVISGKGYVQVQNEKLLAAPGKLLYMDLSRSYKYYSHKKDPWEFVWIYFGGKDAEWYYNLITGGNRFAFDLGMQSAVPAILNEIYELYVHKDAFTEHRVHAAVTNLLTTVYIESKGNDKELRPEFYYPDPVNTVINFIEQNYFRKITLKELAAVTFLNPYYLLRLFKKYTGYTPNEYLNKFRMDFSKNLLQKPEVTIEQIALNLGFNSHSYFSRVFSRNTGLTPEQFRKMYMR